MNENLLPCACYIAVPDTHGIKYERVKGYRFNSHGRDWFIHRCMKGEAWACTEPKTGRLVYAGEINILGAEFFDELEKHFNQTGFFDSIDKRIKEYLSETNFLSPEPDLIYKEVRCEQ